MTSLVYKNPPGDAHNVERKAAPQLHIGAQLFFVGMGIHNIVGIRIPFLACIFRDIVL